MRVMSENGHVPQPDQHSETVPLPLELAAFLRAHGPYACLTQATDQGTVYILKAPRVEIQRVHGTLPVTVSHELYLHPSSPVIRTLLTLYDDPAHPLAFESFINIADDDQRGDFIALAAQDHLVLLFYDETLAHRLTKRVSHSGQGRIKRIVQNAQAELAAIGAEQVDFDRAKADVIKGTTL